MAQNANPSTNTTNALLIGWASTNITPAKPVQLHGQFHERVSQSVHDPCTATALALERTGPQGTPEQAIMVSCDLVSVDRRVVEQVQAAVRSRLPDFDVRKLILNATHTHTGPTLVEGIYCEPAPGVMRPTQYAEFFVAQVSDAIVCAWKNRKPGAALRRTSPSLVSAGCPIRARRAGPWLHWTCSYALGVAAGLSAVCWRPSESVGRGNQEMRPDLLV